MNLFLSPTDHDWYTFLMPRRPDEVNFWRPGGSMGFRALTPGEPFLFKAKSPHKGVIGGGFFVRFVRAPVSLAWQAFGEKNGAPHQRALLERIRRYRHEPSPDPEIGCILLNEPFFFPRELWVDEPLDWSREIVSGKRYATTEPSGARLWDAVAERMADGRVVMGPNLPLLLGADANGVVGVTQENSARYGAPTLFSRRLGQGSFRLGVLDAYQRRCAVTGERVVPVLEAAHIRPYADDGPHSLANGLSLRADIHRLFDLGYVTVDADLHFRVSRLLDIEYANGKDYYRYQDQELMVLPRKELERPGREYLEWHRDVRFRP